MYGVDVEAGSHYHVDPGLPRDTRKSVGVAADADCRRVHYRPAASGLERFRLFHGGVHVGKQQVGHARVVVVGYPAAVFEGDLLVSESLCLCALRLPEHEAEVDDQVLVSGRRPEGGRLHRPEYGLDFTLDGAAGHVGSPHWLGNPILYQHHSTRLNPG